MNKAEINPNKCLICGRPTHKESKYCIFHAFEKEKTEEEFKQALKEYVNKIKEEDGDYDFKKFIFVGHINFKKDLNINIFKNACFSGATFQGMVFFLETCFKGKADFIWTVFKGNAYFTSEPFKGEVNFLRANFLEQLSKEMLTSRVQSSREILTLRLQLLREKLTLRKQSLR